MEKKKSFGDKLEAFFAGKGFYIVLFLCIAVIGISAWVMLDGTGTDVDNNQLDEIASDPLEPELPVAVPMEPDEDTYLDEDPEDETPVVNQEPVDAVQEPVAGANTGAAAEQPVMAQATMYIWPMAGEVEVPYSVAALVYNKTMADWRIHDGIDISAEMGTQVMAAAAGVVERVFSDDMYGTTVVINHGGGVKSYYSNLSETPTVYEGDSVTAGEVIGATGDTALSEAGEVVHLHFAMTLNGESVDPMNYLPDR